MRTVRNINVAVESELFRSSPKNAKISPCTPVNASQPHSLQQLATQQSVPVQDKYSSISTLNFFISKAL
jgi:hypothetical protein